MGDLQVVLENESLKETIDFLNLQNHCITKGQSWYLDYRKGDYVILSRMRKSKLIQTGAKIYLTMRNDNIIFILFSDEEDVQIRKTGFKVDLSEFKFRDLTFENSTYWILKEDEGKIEILKEYILECD